MQFLSGQVNLAFLGEKLVVPVGDFTHFSCELIGNPGSGVLDILKKVDINSPAEYAFSSPHTVLSASYLNHFNLDVTGVSAIVFTVTTVQADAVVTINTFAERH